MAAKKGKSQVLPIEQQTVKVTAAEAALKADNNTELQLRWCFQLRGMQMGVKHQPHFKHLDMNGKNEVALEGNDMMHIDIQSMIRYLDIFGLCQNRGHIYISKWRVEC